MAMAAIQVAFQNMASIRVQAQIYIGRTLISSCVAGPGESLTLTADSPQYDIFFKDGSTGWEIARRLNSEAKHFTLSQHKGRYIIT